MLCKPPNRLEAALARGGPSWSGVGEDLLRQAIETDSLADHRLSPTLAAVGPAAITLGAGA